MSPSPPSLEFFIDRSLGKRAVAATLRSAGWNVPTLAEVYGDQEESVPDTEWLERCGRQGWVVLTKDRRIRYRPAEIAAIRSHNVKAFVLPRGNLTAADQSQRFIDNAERIVSACKDDGPFVVAVYQNRLEYLYPPPERS